MVRNTGGEHKGVKPAQIIQRGAGNAGGLFGGHLGQSVGQTVAACVPIIPCLHMCAAGAECLHGGQAVAAQPQNGKTFHGKHCVGEGAHRSFSVARPHMPSTMETIQNRMTIFGSAQPFFSKWWWMGAIRNTRRPVRLYQKT